MRTTFVSFRKRIVVAAFILFAALCIWPVTAHAEAKATFNKDSGTLTISGDGIITIDDALSATGTKGSRSVTNVVIEDGATGIRQDTFNTYFPNMTSISLPASVTTIGKRAFYNCTSLRTISLPDGLTSIGENAFCGCKSLESITIPANVTAIGERTFYDCTDLSDVTFAGNSKLERIGPWAFAFCSKLNSISLPDGVTDIGNYAFYGCSSLTTITIPDSVTSIDERAFGGCTSLAAVNYTGTKEQWDALKSSIGKYNDSLKNAVKEKSISEATVEEIPDRTYTGSEIRPSVTVKDGDTTLTAGTDYTVSYSDNRNAGTATVTITGMNWYTGTITRNFTISPARIQITGVTVEDKTYDGTADAEVTVTSAEGLSDFENADVRVHVDAKFADANAGQNKTVNLTYSLSGTDAGNFTVSGPAAAVAAIRRADPQLSVEAVSDPVYSDTGFRLRVTRNGDGMVSYVSGNSSVLTVDNTGEVHIAGAGSAAITVSLAETANYTGASDTIQITVGQADGKITIENTEIRKVYGDDPFSVNPMQTTGGDLTYRSGSPSVASVDSNGTVTIHGAGEAVITISMAATQNHKAVEEDVTVRVGKLPVSVQWSGTASFPYDGATHRVTASAANLVGSDTVNLTIENNEASAAGSYTAKVTALDNANYTLEGGHHLTYEWAIVRAAAKPASQPASERFAFTDVPAGAYYYDAVRWAAENGITSGTSAAAYSPHDPCTRGQMATFLWKLNGSPKVSGTMKFEDVASGAYYHDAVLWCYQQGITSGTSDTTFSPSASCTRGQTAVFLYQMRKSPKVTGRMPFTDVNGSAYYSDAVLWASQNRITSGTSAGENPTYSPGASCTRGQIAVFLYHLKDVK